MCVCIHHQSKKNFLYIDVIHIYNYVYISVDMCMVCFSMY